VSLISRCFFSAAALLIAAAPAAAQNEAVLKTYFEGKRVTVKIDMPATSDGIDLMPETAKPMDAKSYGDRLKRTGIAIHAGESAVVTLVHVKKDLIEFQLGGGGFGHDTGSVYMPLADKSDREKDLEKRVKAESDPLKKKVLQRELDDLVAARERENNRIRRERARLEEENKARIAVERLSAGSRFNLRYDKSVPEGTGPQDVVAALAEYVEFSPAAGAPMPPPPMPPPLQIGGITLRKGLLRADVERDLGRPIESADRREGGIVVTTLVFRRGEQRIMTEFVEGVLVRYSVTSR
jgi:hypothetical protein